MYKRQVEQSLEEIDTGVIEAAQCMGATRWQIVTRVLLVDIQAKLQAGKGAGYARWAKVFNLKQMAQTMNYLSEHNLLE